MPEDIKISEAAALLGVSDDTVRRWGETGRLTIRREGGPAKIDPRELAALAVELARDQTSVTPGARRSSARNRVTGLVTKVTRDTVMAQVELQAGPFRFVSLMSREAADELGLEPGSIATASVKATNVTVEVDR
ncbi:MAG: TOBE domain-containing protein [Naasia sp.]